jgi:hypothetical protein
MSRARDTANQINRVNSSAADATAITVDSSENIMIGTTVAGRATEGADRLTIADASHSGMTIRSGENSYGSINFSDSEGGAGEYSGQIWYGHGSLGEKLVMAIQGSNKVTVDGDGLKFNNDTAAANALNDYEEGTFTPTVTVGTLGDAGGAYTKIGNTVIAYMYMGAFSNRSSGSILTINNLPFTSANALANGAGGSIFSRYCNKIPNATYVSNNSTNVEMYESATGNYDTVKHDDLNDVSAYFFIQVIYKTAS